MSQTLQPHIEKTSDEVTAAWSKLVSCATRAALARCDMRYRELASELGKLGVSESARSLEGKVHRGTFKFSFFLQVLVATKTECPPKWAQALAAESSWEQRATAVFRGDMSERPWLTYNHLSLRLRDIGVHFPDDSLQVQIEEGTLSAALFLQYATVCRAEFAYRFVDPQALNCAAVEGARIERLSPSPK
jgi:hypothetical protein